MATESKEASLCNDVPKDYIAVLAAGGKDGAGGTEAYSRSSGAVAVERRLAGAGLGVPQPDAPIGMATRNLNKPTEHKNQASSLRNVGSRKRGRISGEAREGRSVSSSSSTEEAEAEAAAGEEATQETAREAEEEEEGVNVAEGRPRLRSQAAKRSRAAASRRRPEGS